MAKMTGDDVNKQTGERRASGMTAPLRYPVFRRMWSASLFTNFGLLIQGVGAAWAMTQLTTAADMVAFVQSAAMLPMMLFALPAGAIADMYDRRIVGMIALSIGFLGAATLTLCAWAGLLTPGLILLFSFIIGCGIALFGPSWQASVGEQVPPENVPEAIALNSISFNIARSFGPAIGGVIVASLGVAAAFLVNALFFIPMMVVLFFWKRQHEPSRLPPERLNRAVVSGIRYVFHAPAIRVVILRTILTGAIGCVLSALMPLIARDLLGGTAETFGLLLGAFGIGAVAGALNVASTRARFRSETIIRGCIGIMGLAILVVAVSRSLLLTGGALMIAGACWMIAITIFNIGVQTTAPRWVAGRALAAFQASIAGGVAVGSWGWGHVVELTGIETTLLIAGVATILSLLLGGVLRVPQPQTIDDMMAQLDTPEVNMALTGRSGPVVISVEYEVPRHRARAFHNTMQAVQLMRQRNGAYGWSISRDISQPELWTERFQFPTWNDYLRARARLTLADQGLIDDAFAFHVGKAPPRVARKLERPFGSVRWREDVRDVAPGVLPLPPGASGP